MKTLWLFLLLLLMISVITDLKGAHFNSIDIKPFHGSLTIGSFQGDSLLELQKKRIAQLINEGKSALKNGTPELAEGRFLEAGKLSSALTLLEESARVAYYFGTLQLQKGNTDSALYYFFKSADGFDTLSMNSSLSSNYLRIGNIYRQLEDTLAIRYYQKSIVISEEEKNSSQLAAGYQGIGNVFAMIKEYDSASYYYRNAIEILDMLGNKGLAASVRTNLGNLAFELKKYPEAEIYYKQSIKVNEALGRSEVTAAAYNNIANIHSNLKQYDSSNFYFLKAYDLSTKVNSVIYYPKILEGLFLNYQEMGKSAEALKYYLKLDSINNKLFKDDFAQKIAEMETKYQSQKKNNEIILQQAEINKGNYERNMILMIALFLVLVIGLICVAYIRKRKDHIKLTYQKSVISRREEEKGLLLRELHHRVKNNLQLVSSILNLQASQLTDASSANLIKESQSRVEAMALIHRDLYLKNDSTKVSLCNYIMEMFHSLLKVYDYKKDSVKSDIKISTVKIDADTAIPLGLIINELLSNVFKHAFKQQQHPELKIHIEVHDGNRLFMLIEDNGLGIDLNNIRKNSFGRDMVETLVKQLNATMEISNEGGCQIKIEIPLKHQITDSLNPIEVA